MNDETRTEQDALGTREIPADVLWGIHTARALENFPLTGRPVHPELIRAMGLVKQACAQTSRDLGYLDQRIADAIINACSEVANGRYAEAFVVDALAGGAGTSVNMNANEVIASLANETLGGRRGIYDPVHPLDHVNLHQSTNDVFPTAVRVAVLAGLKRLETASADLQASLQKHEETFRDVLRPGRTQLRDAVPLTLGMTFSAWAEAIARDRWRIFKSRERIKIHNLGGTAIGTGLGAPRDYIFRAGENLRRLCGFNIARSENLVDTTQNLDPFVEVSGMLKTMAVNLYKISSDLRLLSSGPATGLGEINLPPMQTGSSIMAGKVNPVIPEAVSQAALKVMGADGIITQASALGQLELNHLLPLVADEILSAIALLTRASDILNHRCIGGITANREHSRKLVFASPMLTTVLVPVLGYDAVDAIVKKATEEGIPVMDAVLQDGRVDRQTLDRLLSPEAMYRLGFVPEGQ